MKKIIIILSIIIIVLTSIIIFMGTKKIEWCVKDENNDYCYSQRVVDYTLGKD